MDEALTEELEQRFQMIDSVTEFKDLINLVLLVPDLSNFMDYLPTIEPEEKTKADSETEGKAQTLELIESLPEQTLEKEYL